MLERQRIALNPRAVETNRAGRISGDQRFQLSARATAATLGWVSMTFFAMIAWWLVFAAETRWMAGPGIIATVIAPLAPLIAPFGAKRAHRPPGDARWPSTRHEHRLGVIGQSAH